MRTAPIFHALYVFKKRPGQKSAYRYDLIASTGNYKGLEHRATRERKESAKLDAIRKGQCFCYVNPIPAQFSTHAKQSAQYSLTQGKNNVSSIFFPSPLIPTMARGDYMGDALIFTFSNPDGELMEDGTIMEIYVSKAAARQSLGMWENYVNGRISRHAADLRAKVVAEDGFFADAQRWHMMNANIDDSL